MTNLLGLPRKAGASSIADPSLPMCEQEFSLYDPVQTTSISEKRQPRYLDNSLDPVARQHGNHRMEEYEIDRVPAHILPKRRKFFELNEPSEPSVPRCRLWLEVVASVVAAISTVVIYSLDRWLISDDADSQPQWQAFDYVSPPASIQRWG